MKLKAHLVLLIVLVIVLLECEGGRRGGGSRSSSSSGGWFGSRRKSSSSNRGSSSGSSWFNFGKKKTNSNPKSSYPKQQYGSGGSNIGSRTNTNSQSSYPKQQYGGTNTGVQSKTNINSQSSYPKQQYGSNTGVQSRPGQQSGGSSIGGGGFVNTGNKVSGGNTGWTNTGGRNNIGGGGWANTGNSNNNRYGSNTRTNWNNNRNNYGSTNYRNNYYHNRGNIYSGTNYNSFGSGYGRQNYGYYGGGVFNNQYRTSGGLFGGGKKSFALGAGAGFLGGAMAGVAAMSMYHRYRMYSSMMMYHNGGMGYGGYGGYGGGYGYGHNPYGYGGAGRRGMLLADEYDCVGGCPMNAFCDYGICRCRTGYDAKYGRCWNRIEDFNRNQDQWQLREQSGFNPYKTCSAHNDCENVDMNMFCDSEKGSCQCRNDMKWNEETLECQIYMNVNCTDVKTVESPNANATLVSDEPDDEYDDQAIYNSTNLLNADGKLNVSEITAEETLATSELTKLDPNETTTDEIRQAFCRDIARVARSYEQTLEPPTDRDLYNDAGKGVAGAGIIGLIIFLGCTCCVCFLICKFLSKIKEMCCGDGKKGQEYDRTSQSSSDAGHRQPESAPVPMQAMNNPDPYANNAPAYPPVAAPAYPPQPDNTMYPQIPPDPNLPPLGPAIPPTQPGYGAAPYPPVPGGVPYPPGAPPGGAPPPYAAAPYPPATAAPVYPPAPAAAPAYPPAPSYPQPAAPSYPQPAAPSYPQPPYNPTA